MELWWGMRLGVQLQSRCSGSLRLKAAGKPCQGLQRFWSLEQRCGVTPIKRGTPVGAPLYLHGGLGEQLRCEVEHNCRSSRWGVNCLHDDFRKNRKRVCAYSACEHAILVFSTLHNIEFQDHRVARKSYNVEANVRSHTSNVMGGSHFCSRNIHMAGFCKDRAWTLADRSHPPCLVADAASPDCL